MTTLQAIPKLPHRQHGVVLVIALVLLVAITLLSLAGISTTTLELQMATNQQERVNAFQQAEAGIDAVFVDDDNFAVKGRPGRTRCTTDFNNTSKYYEATDVKCQSPNIDPPPGFSLNHSRVAVERIRPLERPCPRACENTISSKVASFKVDSRYDARDANAGRAEHNQGVIVVLPSRPEVTRIPGL